MNVLVQTLADIGAIDRESLELFHPRVRDRDDIQVLRDPVSEVILLSRSDHVSESYYEERREHEAYAVRGERVWTPRLDDNVRRAQEFGGYIRNKCWLDFGCGLGGMLDEIGGQASSAIGLEPSRERAAIVRDKGHRVVQDVREIEPGSLDVVTMFHVLEHLTDPFRALRDLKSVLKPGGVLLVEVPHARDALITLFDCEAFKSFTFWSEHLVLHTRMSLRLMLRTAGFEDLEVSAFQRYPLSNHLHWLARSEPAGHDVWRFLSNRELETAYGGSLAAIDRTDTLIALCRPTASWA
ncbi:MULTISPECIES: class I SAM-dependent methyltransferase [unclassified Thioalkalivibrio]|uniref:class I SAM-dependent methyltransferase n=1 Tax=unclassified Thioalkalivibrio TaxID=2621013 RepID=UPI0009DAC7FB|nr:MULTISPECIES: class I SAM-dependent methyltransferase [unclassified Thioalkalivibrio]